MTDDHGTVSDVVAWLNAQGFAETQPITNAGVVGRIAGGRFVGGRFSCRRKFRRADIGVTVGKRTTCVYRIDETRGPCDFVCIPTKDSAGVRVEVLERIGI